MRSVDYMPNAQVWFIRNEDGKPTIRNGLIETAVVTTYVNKDSITHEVYYIIDKCIDGEQGRKLKIELDSSRVFGSKKEAEEHMSQIIK